MSCMSNIIKKTGKKKIRRNRMKIRTFEAVLWVRIFLGLPDPHPDPLVTSSDLAPDLPSTSKNSKKNLDFYCFTTSLLLFNSVPDPDPSVFGPPASTFGSVRQR